MAPTTRLAHKMKEDKDKCYSKNSNAKENKLSFLKKTVKAISPPNAVKYTDYKAKVIEEVIRKTKPAKKYTKIAPMALSNQNITEADKNIDSSVTTNVITKYFSKGPKNFDLTVKKKKPGSKPRWAGATESFQKESSKVIDPYDFPISKTLQKKKKKKTTVKRTTPKRKPTEKKPYGNFPTFLDDIIIEEPVVSNCENQREIEPQMPAKDRLCETDTPRKQNEDQLENLPTKIKNTERISLLKSTPKFNNYSKSNGTSSQIPFTQPQGVQVVNFGDASVVLSPIKSVPDSGLTDPPEIVDLVGDQLLENVNDAAFEYLDDDQEPGKMVSTPEDSLYSSFHEYSTVQATCSLPGLYESPIKLSPISKHPRKKVQERPSFRQTFYLSDSEVSEESNTSWKAKKSQAAKQRNQKQKRVEDEKLKSWMLEMSQQFEEAESVEFIVEHESKSPN